MVERDVYRIFASTLPKLGALLAALVSAAQLLGAVPGSDPGPVPLNHLVASGILLWAAVALAARAVDASRLAAVVASAMFVVTVGLLAAPTELVVSMPLPGANARAGLACLAAAITLVRVWSTVAGVFGSISLSIGLVAFTGNVLSVPTAFAWAGQAAMPIGTSLAMVCLSVGVVVHALALHARIQNDSATLGPVLLGLTAATCGVLFWYALRVQEINQINRTVRATTLGVGAEVEGRIGSMAFALGQLAQQADKAGLDSAGEWRADARLTVGAFPGFEAIEYIDERLERRVVAKAVSESAPEPPLSEQDLNLLAATVAHTVEAGLPSISGPFVALDGKIGFRVVISVQRDGTNAYVSGLFSAPQTFASLFRNLAPGYAVLIRCGTRTVFSRGTFSKVDPGLIRLGYERLALKGPFPWTVEVAPNETLLATHRTGLPQIALGSSLLIAFLLGLTARFGLVSSRRATSFLTAVNERTDELQEAMDVLAKENRQRRRSESVVLRIQEVSHLLSGELNLEKVVQAVTDAATQLTGAEVGAFFYKLDESTPMQFAISGIDRSAFDGFETPGGRGILGATVLQGEIVLCEDVTLDPRYGTDGPHHGMPEGHPVKVVSYLGVPVISRGGTSWGALVFAHSRPAVFTLREQEMASGLASQAAIAMQNASLYTAEQTAKAEAQSASHAKDRFLAMLSHELRNPLSSITTALAVSGSSSAPPEQRERMQEVATKQVEHLSRMVDDLLDMSRVEQGRLALQVVRLDIAKLVRDHCEPAASRVREARLRFDSEIAESPLWVDGDATRITQILDNLLSNAIKFTPSDGLVSVRLLEDAGEQVRIAVQDSGRGIEPDYIDHVFDLFGQTDESLDRAAGGLGLGLTIARRLAEAHGGSLSVSSDGPGKGACFELVLPLRDAPEDKAPRRKRRASTTETKRIVVIDDHQDSADGLAEVLRMRGHLVEVAYEGETGLTLIRSALPDVVVCDIGLPGMDGFEVARRIRETARGKDLFLIALTGYGDAETVEKAGQAGFDHHLTKPVSLAVLNRLLRSMDTA